MTLGVVACSSSSSSSNKAFTHSSRNRCNNRLAQRLTGSDRSHRWQKLFKKLEDTVETYLMFQQQCRMDSRLWTFQYPNHMVNPGS